MNVNRIVNSLKTRGIKGSLDRLKKGAPLSDVIGFWNFITIQDNIPFCIDDYEANKNKQLVLNWVVPEMGKGSGGHINIFRFISYLERKGIHNRLYLFNSMTFGTNESIREFIKENFRILDKNVEIFHDTKFMEFAHGTVATSWTTAYAVKAFDNTISKFYFVQDFEPDFYAKGSEYVFAEKTYSFGFRGITAGDWLKQLCIEQYGMKTESFSFSYDKDLYVPKEKKDAIQRVFFYARPVTPRRDFEVGMLALNELCKIKPEVEVIFAGWDVSQYKIPFKHKNMGIVDISKLAELYSQCDLCLIISQTNLSLLPLEVMASGSVAVCTKGPNSEWLVNENNSILVNVDPVEIANTLVYYLNNADELEQIRKQGITFARKTSWDAEGEKVYSAVLKGIEEDEKYISNRR